MAERIGILTGGGDCAGLNAVIRAVVKTAARRGWETLGIHDGFEGLLPPTRYDVLHPRQTDDLLRRGGTILGTTNKGSFAAKVGHGEKRRIDPAVVAAAKRSIAELGLRAVVCIGGDGTLSIAQQLWDEGIPVVGVPKTIDNDLDATLLTFGFESAVDCAVDALDRLATTAESHDRVMVLEVMGRDAGWIAAFAGLAGGADIVLIPEIPFTFESVAARVKALEAEGKNYTLVVVAEGAALPEVGKSVVGDRGGQGEVRLGGVGAIVAKEIEKRTKRETRLCVLGHLQRGGTPTPLDRQLCTRFGVRAVQLIAEERYGHMVASHPPEITVVPIADAVGRIRTVPPDGELVASARAIGISFGND
jgi:6-phosphofructokinase 1